MKEKVRTTITFKKGVRVQRVQPVVMAIISEMRYVFEEFELPQLVVTAISDGEHMPGSKHFSGEAVDFRVWNIPEKIRPFVFRAMQERFGEHYDCIWHKRSHYHVEHDPK